MTETARNPFGNKESPEMQFSLPPLLIDSWIEQVPHEQQCTREPALLVFKQTFSQEPVSSLIPYAEPEWRNVRHIVLKCTGCGESGDDILATQSNPIDQIVKGIVIDFFDHHH